MKIFEYVTSLKRSHWLKVSDFGEEDEIRKYTLVTIVQSVQCSYSSNQQIVLLAIIEVLLNDGCLKFNAALMISVPQY